MKRATVGPTGAVLLALYQLIYWNPHSVVVLSHTQVSEPDALQGLPQRAEGAGEMR